VTFALNKLKFDEKGLLPVIAQEERTGEVLMLAWADKEAILQSQKTGFMHYHSRSRGTLWRKGEESGHEQTLVGLHHDCDGDTVLALVRQKGAACHTGAATCFAQQGTPPPTAVVADLAALIETRKKDPPSGSYTGKLLADENLRTKKIGEEAIELVMALKGEGRDRVASEAADVIYHLLVACTAAGVSWSDIATELAKRRR
jgi:phosphoribosyl-AMP cyclohydrolase / phosphoribosyl-ATP pyrophosphohydrolase